MLRENATLKENIQKGDDESRRFWEIENLLNKTLLEANQMAEEYRAHGRKEAGLLLDKAEEKAGEMISLAREEARTVHAEIMALQSIRRRFRKEMRTTLERFLQFVSGEEELNKEELNFYAFSGNNGYLQGVQQEEKREIRADAVPSHSEE